MNGLWFKKIFGSEETAGCRGWTVSSAMALPAERTSDPEKPVKDYGSISHWSAPLTDDAMQGMT